MAKLKIKSLNLDYKRLKRQSFPEFIYSPAKADQQILDAIKKLLKKNKIAIATLCEKSTYEFVKKKFQMQNIMKFQKY